MDWYGIYCECLPGKYVVRMLFIHKFIVPGEKLLREIEALKIGGPACGNHELYIQFASRQVQKRGMNTRSSFPEAKLRALHPACIARNGRIFIKDAAEF